MHHQSKIYANSPESLKRWFKLQKAFSYQRILAHRGLLGKQFEFFILWISQSAFKPNFFYIFFYILLGLSFIRKNNNARICRFIVTRLRIWTTGGQVPLFRMLCLAAACVWCIHWGKGLLLKPVKNMIEKSQIMTVHSIPSSESFEDKAGKGHIWLGRYCWCGHSILIAGSEVQKLCLDVCLGTGIAILINDRISI